MDRDPDFVVACCCMACQQRTGSPYGTGAYFLKAATTIGGDYKSWSRTADSGRRLTNHFCPECGTNLFWSLDMRPDHLGIALGCLASVVAEPMRAIWVEEKLDWVQFPEHWPQIEKAPPTP